MTSPAVDFGPAGLSFPPPTRYPASMRIKVFVGESLIEVDDGRTDKGRAKTVEALSKRLLEACGEQERERFKPSKIERFGFHTEKDYG